MTSTMGELMRKELRGALRSQQTWARTALLAVLTAYLLGMQIRLPLESQRDVGAALYWFALLIAGLPALERSFEADCEDAFHDSLRLAPVAWSAIYLAKLVVNWAVLALAGALLAILWVVSLDVPLLEHPGAMPSVVLLGSLGIAAVGTLLGAAIAGARVKSGALTLLTLPLVLPVVLAATESTRLVLAGEFGREWGRSLIFLSSYAIVFTIAGSVLFEFAASE